MLIYTSIKTDNLNTLMHALIYINPNLKAFTSSMY